MFDFLSSTNFKIIGPDERKFDKEFWYFLSSLFVTGEHCDQ